MCVILNLQDGIAAFRQVKDELGVASCLDSLGLLLVASGGVAATLPRVGSYIFGVCPDAGTLAWGDVAIA